MQPGLTRAPLAHTRCREPVLHLGRAMGAGPARAPGLRAGIVARG
jgi:hypothetical protein